MSNYAIQVENLGKAYCIGQKDEVHDTLAAALVSWGKAPLRNFRRLRRLNTFRRQTAAVASPGANGSAMGDSNQSAQLPAPGSSPSASDPADIFWALRDVSFQVSPGEVVGVIGRNGAGKSTLLKILSRITDPTTGRAVIEGRVSSLLEVGTGFHPELTGRDNVYMNGTILGMRKREIDRKFDEIVDFSGVEKFLDTPVKRYSSGMKVRLAFAVAAHLEPEILIVDEVLAVGDFEFQKRCIGKMQDVAGSGRTVLFVSHNMSAVQQLCRRGLVLIDGALDFDEEINRAVRKYLGYLEEGARLPLDRNPSRRGSGEVRLTGIRLRDGEGRVTEHLVAGERVTFEFDYMRHANVRGITFGFSIFNELGNACTHIHTTFTNVQIDQQLREGTLSCEIQRLPLPVGHYRISVVIESSAGQADLILGCHAFQVASSVFFPSPTIQHLNTCPVMIDHTWNGNAVAGYSAVEVC